MRPALVVLVTLVIAHAASAASLIVDVRNGRGAPVADAVVYAVPKRTPASPPAAKAVMDQKNRMFIPHVLVIQTGTSVMFPNSDDIRHQVYSFSPAKTFQLPLYQGTPASPVVFDKPGVVAIGCNIHDRMNAYIVVVDTPYFATTTGRKRLALTDLPADTYEVHVWSPNTRSEAVPVRVTLTAGERRELQLTAR